MNKFKKVSRCWQLVFLLLIMQTVIPVVALSPEEKVEPWDENSAIDYRKPPFEIIDSYKKDPAYFYDGDPEGMGLLQRILLKVIQWLISGLSGQSWLLYVLGGFAIIIVFLLVLRLLNIPFSGIFSFSGGSSVSVLEMVHPAEGMTRMEMEKLYKLYKSNGAYREAVRVLYLMYLKNLHQGRVIRLNINKTNKDYLHEIKDDTIFKDFKKLSRLYDYVWFGQFNIVDQEFFQIEKEFSLTDMSGSVKMEANG